MTIWTKAMNSLEERARHFAARRRKRRFVEKFGVESAAHYPMELLETFASLKAMLPHPPDTLIDVGAHRGHFAHAADQFFDLQRIFCFEPTVDLIPELEATVSSNKLKVYPIALSNYCGLSEFYLHQDRSMNSTVPVVPDVLDRMFPFDCAATITKQQVATSTLDAALAGEEFVDAGNVLLKIDTQGNELQVLEGAAETLSRTLACLVEYIFTTPYERRYCFEELIAFFNEHEFACSGALSINRPTAYRVTAVDFLFVKA